MSVIYEKEILQRLKILSNVVPTLEATARAIQRVRNALKSERKQPEIGNIRKGLMIMRSRIAKLTAAAVVVLGVLGILALLTTGNGSASITFAQVIEPIRQAQSLSYTETTQVEGRAAGVRHHAIQFELGRSRRSVEGGRITITQWQPEFGMLSLDPATKTAKITKSTGGLLRVASTPVRGIIDELDIIDDVKDFQAGQETNLGTKQINGRKAVGFRVRYYERDYDVWADARTSAPVRIECEYTLRDGRKLQTTITDIEFNELDESLFSLDPPKGYSTE